MLIAVIRRGARLLLDRHNHFGFDRLDRQRTVCRLRNDILFCSVYSALSSVREDSVIRSDIRSLRANFDRAEISAFRRTGKAGNAMLVSIISHRGAVRRQRDVLIIVEVKNVIAIDNRERRFLTRHQRVARNIGVLRGHSFAERLSSCCGGFNLFLCSVQIIVYRVVFLRQLVINRCVCIRLFKRECYGELVRN